MNVAVIGAGYVGLVSAAGFAEFGNSVVCVDTNAERIDGLRSGRVPIYEPGLDGLIHGNAKAGRLSFTTDAYDAVSRSEIVFIAVGTPPLPDGSTDLAQVLQAARVVGDACRVSGSGKTVVMKSTVPIGTTAIVGKMLSSYRSDISCVSNPEFLREGTAVDDFLRPDQVVIGVNSDSSRDVMLRLYRPIVARSTVVVTDPASSELTKYATNAMLAVRISFMNELSNVAAATGADIDAVRSGLGADSRIGPSYLYPGPGFGGSCLPKDLMSLVHSAKVNGVRLRIVEAAVAVNESRKHKLFRLLHGHFGSLRGKTVAVWGLAFKAGTDDVRESPAVTLVEDLAGAGAKVVAHDPKASETAASYLARRGKLSVGKDVVMCDDMYEAVRGADALALCTEWREYRNPDVSRILELSHDISVFDGRNVWDPSDFRSAGVPYASVTSSVLGEEDDLHPV